MGKLLALSLTCTLASAVLFQPALMGEPRTKAPAGPTPTPAEPAAPSPEAPKRKKDLVPINDGRD